MTHSESIRAAVSYAEEVIKYCLLLGYRQATKYVSPVLIVRCTSRFKHKTNSRMRDFVLTIGAPNYRERIFVKNCVLTKEPFPVKKVQLKEWKNGRKR